MKQDCPSLTAHKIAMMRASHQVLDDPKVFEDPIALRILGTQGDSDIHIEKRRFKTRLHSYLRAMVVARSRFAEDEPSFLSMLGVTMYLTLETMMATMEYITSSTPPGSGIVFDYVVHPSSQNYLRRLVFRLLARRLARAGEPWVCFLDPHLLVMDLKTIGFTQAEDIGPEEINTRFFKDRADKLMVGNFGHLMKAQL
jgi:O-methyltransferase involved in polyketide biosynthesis